ncbi:GNAT family N-acetyltransferase [Nocardioides panaciterrulae]|uniref:GNAT superfamily N-acetyltransferase n=1 Tax=Nocardioides panaciterrulae TaxID=661492 RepID=A0A7Y9E404_9ACTN|nr:GNAT superfamily N-acetyltransferase [Nocardioides panaciterrulae]
MTGVREVPADRLAATSTTPFVRHQVDPAATDRAWVSGRAVVVQNHRGRPGEVLSGPVLTCLGPPEDLVPLMAALAEAGVRPGRLSVEDPSYDGVPAAWSFTRQGHWHWMLSDRPVVGPVVGPGAGPVVGPGGGPTVRVEEADDPAEVDAVLDVANPGSFARPGTPGIECWLGIREAGRLVAVGALRREADGTGHLRGVSVLPSHTGRGLGGALSAALTRRAQAGASGVATLGVYVDNLPALAIYRRLGYVVEHTFSSGPLASGELASGPAGSGELGSGPARSGQLGAGQPQG